MIDVALFHLILLATWQTCYMVLVSAFFAVLIGLPLGVVLAITRRCALCPMPLLYQVLGVIVNAMRSVPFIILMIAIIPLTRWVVGVSIGTVAAIVPLSIAAFPFVARVIETAIADVDAGLIEAMRSMGATTWQVISKLLIPEALPGIISGVTLMVVTLVGYSAMAGVVGGGGLGDLAIRYGYERFNLSVMLVTVLILIVMVQLLQSIGDWLAKRCAHDR